MNRDSAAARLTLLAAVLAIVLEGLVVGAGCTSFSFRGSGRGTAPADLRDRTSMVRVESGTFEMGASSAEPDEHPPHRVELGAFLMDKTEVTLADYQRCVDARVCKATELADPSEGITPQHPVVGVSWFDAMKYCEWVGKRLPTEAEWEYAARSPRFGPFPWDGTFEPGKANLRGDGDGYARTAPVGSFPRGQSGLGLFDMAGNVAEWTSDWYDATWYPKSPGKSPSGPEASTGSKVVRGGSWSDNEYLARAGARLGVDPNRSNDAVGFRCAAGG